MGLLKRKEEKTETMSVRVPASVKAELDGLRQRAEAAGFDLAATMTDALTRVVKQIAAELGECAGKAEEASRGPRVNRLADAGAVNGAETAS